MSRSSTLLLSLALTALISGCPDKAEAPAEDTDPGSQLTPALDAPSVDLGLPEAPGPRDAKQVIDTVWRNLDKAGFACPRGFDYGASGGMRTIGCKLASLVSYASLGRMAGVKVFRSGPHTAEQLDLDNPKDFGRYDPAFVRWAVDHLVPAATNPRLGIATRPAYEKLLRPLARAFFLVALERQRAPESFARLVKEYEGRLARAEPIMASHDQYLSYMNASPFNQLEQGYATSLDELVVNTTTGFWVRRTVDGTDAAFLAGLEKLLSVYDGDFLRAAKALAKNPPPVYEEVEEGYYGEEPEEELRAPKVTGDPIRDGWLGLEATRSTCSEFDYFPDGGMRIFACHGFSLLPYAELVRLAGVSPFTSGPHSDTRLELDHASEFGHYNPAFVRWAVDHLIPGAEDDAFRNRTQSLYDEKVRPLARTFMVVRRDIERRPDRFREEVSTFRQATAAGSLQPGWYEDYYSYLDADAAGRSDFSADGNVVNTCVAFWIRREVDGTAALFARGLEKLMKAYDPSF